MGAVVLDSSVLIGFLDPADAHHHAATRRLENARAAGEQFILPATVLAEIMISRTRSDPASAKSAMHDLIITFGPLRAVDEDIAFAAAQLRATHPGLRLPDALMLATAVLEKTTAITFDQRLVGVTDEVELLYSD